MRQSVDIVLLLEAEPNIDLGSRWLAGVLHPSLLLRQLGIAALLACPDWTGLSERLDPLLSLAPAQKAPRREFQPKGAYKLIRHPVYMSFLGLIWFTPRMTLDHAALTFVWTAYIFYGSVLKDRRLEFFLGKTYVDYQQRVPGYPLVMSGPLGRRVPERVPFDVEQGPTDCRPESTLSRTLA